MFSVEIPKVTFLIVFTIYLSITNFRGERFILAQDLMGDDPSGQKKKKSWQGSPWHLCAQKLPTSQLARKQGEDRFLKFFPY